MEQKRQSTMPRCTSIVPVRRHSGSEGFNRAPAEWHDSHGIRTTEYGAEGATTDYCAEGVLTPRDASDGGQPR